MARARALARALGHSRVGSEHLLLALSSAGGSLGVVLGTSGANEAAIRTAMRRATPLGAAAAADRDTLMPFGVDMDAFLARLGPSFLDQPAGSEPLLPFGAAAARRRCLRLTPPLGLDAQATYEASLRLALARRDRDHRPGHLALALVALDPGVGWMLDNAGIDAAALLAELARNFPPPHRNRLLRAERRAGRRLRHHDIVQRYQRTTGRTVTTGGAVATLIAG